MLKRIAAAVAAILMAALIVSTPNVAVAASGTNSCVFDGESWVCTGSETSPGGPGSPPEGDGSAPIGFTPGPSECSWNKPGAAVPVVVECGDANGGWWSNSAQCYWSLANPQRVPPYGESASVGAWYRCAPLCDMDFQVPGDCVARWSWEVTPPPGIVRYTPAQAAALLATRLVLRPVTIGMAPAEKVHSDDPAGTAPYRRTWVGIPVWAWVDNPTDEQWGSQTITDTLGGVTITLTASTGGVWWDAGDGQQTLCGLGTAFDINYWYNKPAQDSPDCGWRFTKTGTYTVTAITSWTVEWTGGGESGQIVRPSTSASVEVQVNELQSLNVNADSDG